MEITKVLEKASESMYLIAAHFKDKSEQKYTAKLHAEAVGFCIKQAVKAGLEPTTTNLAAMVYALYNHSRWRQSFEAKGLFPKAEKRTVEAMESDLDEEFGEDAAE